MEENLIEQEEFMEEPQTEEEKEQSENEKIQELLYRFESLTGGESDFNFSVTLYKLERRKGQKPAREFINDYNYIPALSELRDDYGAGDYQLYLTFLYEGKEILRTKDFSISAIKKKSEIERIEENQKEKILLDKIEQLEKKLVSTNEQQAKAENQELIKLVLQQSENSKNEIREMFTLMQQQQNTLMQKFLEQPKPVVSNNKDLDFFLRGLEYGRDVGYNEGENQQQADNSIIGQLAKGVASYLDDKFISSEETKEIKRNDRPNSLEEYEAEIKEE